MNMQLHHFMHTKECSLYPYKVLQAISKALDDPKRAVRQEAVRCRQAWFGQSNK